MARKQRKSRRTRKAPARKTGAGTPIWLLAVPVALIVVTAGAIFLRSRSPSPGQAVPTLANIHLSSLDESHIPYNSDPPTSGPHIELHAPGKIMTEPLEKEIQVHELEHGGIMVQYDCDHYAGDCSELVGRLGRVVDVYDQAILAPYPDMDRAIALTAWGRLLFLDEFDQDAIEAFIKAYIGINHGG